MKKKLRRLPSEFFVLPVLAAMIVLPAAACGGDGGEEDAGAADADVPEFHGCDIMEFAPEYRTRQFSESALLNLPANALGYFKEEAWFKGGTDGIWMLDAIRFSAPIDPNRLTAGSHQLSGNDLGNSHDCELCLDLGQSDLDNGTDTDFYPERVRIDVESADLIPGGSLKFRVSGIFRENADSTMRSWCVNALEVNAVLEQMCSDSSTCPEDKPVCDYPATGSYPICMKEASDAGE